MVAQNCADTTNSESRASQHCGWHKECTLLANADQTYEEKSQLQMSSDSSCYTSRSEM